MTPQLKTLLFAAGAFLAAWQGANFELDYRAVLGALTAAILGAANPRKATNAGDK